uniref:HA2 domain-containing protein n=1 Tax=Macrostomum lignano TaxID=282301 RepID=A0A1I8GKC2_9PLAT
MRHALPAYIRPFLVCLRGLAGPEAAVSYRAVTFNRDPDGRDFGQLTAQEQPLHSDEALLRLLSEVKFMRYPDPARSERVPVGHLGRLLSGLISSSCSGSAAERHLLLIVHSRFEDNMDQLKSALEPLTSLTILSPRRNDQLTELFGLVNGKEDLGDSGISPHPKWELVLVPECIRLSPPLPPQQAAAPAQVQRRSRCRHPPPPRRCHHRSASVERPAAVQQAESLPGNQCAVCAARALVCRLELQLLRPAAAVRHLRPGIGKDRLLVRPAANAEMSPLLRLFESASSNSAQMALIFCDLKDLSAGRSARRRPAGALPVRAQPPQTQPHVMVYMLRLIPPTRTISSRSTGSQIVSQPASKFPAGVATTSVYTMHPMQSA